MWECGVFRKRVVGLEQICHIKLLNLKYVQITRISGAQELEKSSGPRIIKKMLTLFFLKKLSGFEIYFW